VPPPVSAGCSPESDDTLSLELMLWVQGTDLLERRARLRSHKRARLQRRARHKSNYRVLSPCSLTAHTVLSPCSLTAHTVLSLCSHSALSLLSQCSHSALTELSQC